MRRANHHRVLALPCVVFAAATSVALQAQADERPTRSSLRFHSILGASGAGEHGGVGPGFGVGWTRNSLRAEADVQAATNFVDGGGSTVGLKGGWIFGSRELGMRLPVLLGWRFGDYSNGCHEGVCERAMAHALSIDISVGIPLGSTAEFIFGGYYGIAVASAEWNGQRRVDSRFGGANVQGGFVGFGWDFEQ